MDPSGNPFRVPNEYFILERNEIEFEVSIKGMGKLKGKGRSLLTTHRIVLVNDRSKNDSF